MTAVNFFLASLSISISTLTLVLVLIRQPRQQMPVVVRHVETVTGALTDEFYYVVGERECRAKMWEMRDRGYYVVDFAEMNHDKTQMCLRFKRA